MYSGIKVFHLLIVFIFILGGVSAQDIKTDPFTDGYKIKTPINAQYQGIKNVHYQKVKKARQTRQEFSTYEPFSLIKGDQKRYSSLIEYSALNISPATVNQILQSSDHYLELYIPQSSGEDIIVEMVKTTVKADDIKLVLADGSKFDSKNIKAVHYRGVLRDNPATIAAFSIYEDQIVGMISTPTGNIVIHPSEGGKRGEHISYIDTDLNTEIPFSCDMDELIHPEVDEKSKSDQRSSEPPCVTVYLECDYALFLNKQGTENTVNWITAVYNNVAALYENEEINVLISEIFVWNIADPYSKSNAATAINQFRNLRLSYNGDVAHLISLGGNKLGGVAWLNTLCTSYGYAYSNIHNTYEEVPVYSWTVTVIAHEMGHTFGSNHTQWCGWPDGPIDNCRTPEGTCSPGPQPENGGTIMSYCHLVPGVGINMANGFGIHPGNRMRLRLASVNCLGSGCSNDEEDLPCLPPGGRTASNITTVSANLSWQSLHGVNSYSFRYRQKSTTQWIAINSIYNNVQLNGLNPSTTYEWSVRSMCSNAESSYSTLAEFTTATPASTCGIPGNLRPANITTNSADISWTAVSGAEYYIFEYKIAISSVWTSVNINSTHVRLNGMNHNTSYDVRVRAVCGGNPGPYSVMINFITSRVTGNYCSASAQNSTFEWINFVKFNNLERSSGNDGGYFNGVAMVAEVDGGKSYELVLNAGRTAANYRLFWRVWIDFDGNGSFNEAGEMVVNTSTTGNELRTQIPIPVTAYHGTVRMRIALRFGSQASACGVFTFGEVEDYSVNIFQNENLRKEGLSLEELSDDDKGSISLYPNPVAESLFIQLNGKSVSSYSLLDTYGRMITSQRGSFSGSTLQISTADLVSGNYILILESESEDQVLTERTMHKFVKI